MVERFVNAAKLKGVQDLRIPADQVVLEHLFVHHLEDSSSLRKPSGQQVDVCLESHVAENHYRYFEAWECREHIV